jgi:hypothetical protein
MDYLEEPLCPNKVNLKFLEEIELTEQQWNVIRFSPCERQIYRQKVSDFGFDDNAPGPMVRERAAQRDMCRLYRPIKTELNTQRIRQ